MAWERSDGARVLAGVSPAARPWIARLVDADASTRVAGLDAIGGALLSDGEPTPQAEDLLPALLEFATTKGYPQAGGVLLRLSHLLAAIDDPPRSLAGAGGSEARRRAYDFVGASAAKLVRLAGTSRDPSVARLAGCLAARFPDQDASLEPILIALTSGARDAEERARVFYALTRVQTARGRPLQGRLAEALSHAEPTPEKVAVSLALSAHDPAEPLRGRIRRTLGDARETRLPDPRAPGRTLTATTLDAALTRLG
ncbi:MAG: hypothetical protein VYE22_08250 [Myxococcota bacterium]|nr:hypothetical protein [Myxococcota bacterium]